MKTLQNFTSYDEIRSVLGVSEEELDDMTLALPMHLQTLQLELADIDSTLESQFLTSLDKSSRTTAEQKLVDVVQVYSAYAISKTLLTSLPLFAPRALTDGRAQFERVADPFAGVREGVEVMLAKLRNRIVAALADLGTEVATVTVRSYFGTAGLATNPITNS